MPSQRTARTIFTVVLVVGVVAFIAVWRTRQRGPGFDPVAAAKTRFEEVRGEGVDLSRGLCLGVIAPDWVVDIAHEPRTAADDDPANQCPEVRSGEATHFVELTPDGTLIRVH